MNIRIAIYLFIASTCLSSITAQSISGKLLDEDNIPVEFANVVLYNAIDSTINKVEVSDAMGTFKFTNIHPSDYYISSSYIGYSDISTDVLKFDEQDIDLGELTFQVNSVALEGATVTARRAMVEVKPDRTVFNIEGTINASGSDGIELLRKAPGVFIDNNNNINVLGRSGVIVYIDEKRLPLSGDDLSNYLINLSADQIDKIEIISNPGAKYEAEGNAGIIDIRLKKDKSLGTNASINSSFSMGQKPQFNTNITANNRQKKTNIYGNIGANYNERITTLNFFSTQNNLYLDEMASFENDERGINGRLGLDYFVNDKHTLGLLFNTNNSDLNGMDTDIINISADPNRTIVDSTLVANTTSDRQFQQNSINFNYKYDAQNGFNINTDLDYGVFDIDQYRLQPNLFFSDQNQENFLSGNTVEFDTPRRITIISGKVDFEQKMNTSNLSYGIKLNRINSDNTFEVFDRINNRSTRDDRRSNIFDYDEQVYAGYFNFSRPINASWNMNAGLRIEHTETDGILTAFLPELQEDPISQSYTNWFPNIGFTYAKNPMHSYGISYGRRINRPDYQVLNPFNNQLSEISFERGNPNLQPEIVNNFELSYTWQFRYNFKLSYSRTIDQITRLIGPDDVDPRASFINWDNLAEQTIYNASLSLPIDITSFWSSFINAGFAYIDNQADYGDGAVVDVQTFSYNFYQQQTFKLPKDFVFEISGYYSGPGVWGGVFLYDSNYSLNFGLQKKFLNKKLNVKLSANDVTQQAFWSGTSSFDGLESSGSGRWDSRRVGLALSYNFGNQNVKQINRKTGLEAEEKRVNADQ